jgi:hypothetical protein
MSVGIDEARQDDGVPGIDYERVGDVNLWRHRGDALAFDEYVTGGYLAKNGIHRHYVATPD